MFRTGAFLPGFAFYICILFYPLSVPHPLHDCFFHLFKWTGRQSPDEYKSVAFRTGFVAALSLRTHAPLSPPIFAFVFVVECVRFRSPFSGPVDIAPSSRVSDLCSLFPPFLLCIFTAMLTTRLIIFGMFFTSLFAEITVEMSMSPFYRFLPFGPYNTTQPTHRRSANWAKPPRLPYETSIPNGCGIRNSTVNILTSRMSRRSPGVVDHFLQNDKPRTRNEMNSQDGHYIMVDPKL